MKPTIKVTVSGPQGSGKSLIVGALKQVLASGFPSNRTSDEMQALGRKATVEFEEIQTPCAPASVQVPLGSNKTRDGREARVICIDRDERRPVVALIRQSDGVEATQYYFESGRRGDYEQGLDLVGHLPPEPRKLREIWISDQEDGWGEVTLEETKPKSGKFTLYREVPKP